MTPSDELQRLVERIEGATGPDRELDCDIARYRRVTVMKHDPETGENYETTHWHYTASLDAAMSLVPGELFGVELFVDQATRWGCIVSTSIGDGDSFAATPALAMASASLRARITQEQSNGRA